MKKAPHARSLTGVLRQTTAMILAGGQGERLSPLTHDRAKLAVPFGGIYRIIDFTLSNCLNSGYAKCRSSPSTHHGRLIAISNKAGTYSPVNSILSPRVFVHSWAHVEHCVVFEDVEIGRHARIRRAIIDKGVKIPAGEVIGYDLDRDHQRFTVTENGIVVIPKDTVVEPSWSHLLSGSELHRMTVWITNQYSL